jgi:glycosyltransferase involved in cell wall biosynthesis
MVAVSEKRKVLLVLEATLGGTCRHILDLTKGLLQRGVEVHLVYSDLRADAQFKRGIARISREWPEFRLHEIRITRAVTPSDGIVFYRLFRYIRRNGPFDVIHGHSTKAGFLARLVPGVGKAARIYSPHGFMTMDPQLRGVGRRAVGLLEATLARRSAKVVVLSSDEWKCARSMGIADEKLIMIDNGVDVTALTRLSRNRLAVREMLGIPVDANCIGFIGRFDHKKEPLRLLEAFALVRKKAARSTKLVIIGFGSLESKMRACARDLGIESDIVWAGPVDGTAYMCAFDALGACSRTEAFSYVILEAMATGVPFVSTAVGVARQICDQFGGGLICDPWSPDRFADLMLQVLENPARRAVLVDGARRAAPEFSVTRMVDRICDLYASVAPRAINTEVRENSLFTPTGESR